MSLPTLSGTGTLITDVKKSLTRTDKPMATALLRFVHRRQVDGKWEDGDSFAASVIAFEDAARALAAFDRGADVQIEGRVTGVEVWNEKPKLKVTVTVAAEPVRRSSAERVAA